MAVRSLWCTLCLSVLVQGYAQQVDDLAKNRLAIHTGLSWLAPMRSQSATGGDGLVSGSWTWGYRMGLGYARAVGKSWGLGVESGYHKNPFHVRARLPTGDPINGGWRERKVRFLDFAQYHITATATKDHRFTDRLLFRVGVGLQANITDGVNYSEAYWQQRTEQGDTAFTSKLYTRRAGVDLSLSLRSGVLWRGRRANEWGLDMVLDWGPGPVSEGEYDFDAGGGLHYRGRVWQPRTALGFRLYRTFTWGAPKVPRWMERARQRGVPVGSD